MPTTTPLTDAIQALTTYANETTGASDTTLSEAVATLAAGYGGGGSMGGLANMVDVSSQDYDFGYMFSAMKNGLTTGGTVTYSEAFTNTEQLLLATGLTTIHGFMFCDPAVSISPTASGQVNKIIFVFVNSLGNLNIVSAYSNNVTRSYDYAQGTAQTAVPINGSLRIDGGNIYYTGRYNKNASYQIVAPNKQYEWLAW